MAEAAGFRACYRCRPYRVAAPVTASAPELVCEAVQQIIGGVMDDGGTEAVLAARIGMAALAHLGLRAPAANWRPWLALAAAHLMAYGDALVRTR